jgi:hypothetical protein
MCLIFFWCNSQSALSVNADLETEHLSLTGPFRWQVAHRCHAMTVRKTPIPRGRSPSDLEPLPLQKPTNASHFWIIMLRCFRWKPPIGAKFRIDHAVNRRDLGTRPAQSNRIIAAPIHSLWPKPVGPLKTATHAIQAFLLPTAGSFHRRTMRRLATRSGRATRTSRCDLPPTIVAVGPAPVGRCCIRSSGVRELPFVQSSATMPTQARCAAFQR